MMEYFNIIIMFQGEIGDATLKPFKIKDFSNPVIGSNPPSSAKRTSKDVLFLFFADKSKNRHLCKKNA